MAGARLGLLVAGLVAVGLAFVWMRDIEWNLLKWSLRNQFPAVQWVTTAQLSRLLEDRNSAALFVLDVRTPAEWEVSHIPGARRVDPGADPAVLAGVAKETAIVTYCAVGYRSAEFATRLRAAGFTNVRNLEGSIFEWANEHRPLVSNGARATRVHPYSAFWGRLLMDDVREPVR